MKLKGKKFVFYKCNLRNKLFKITNNNLYMLFIIKFFNKFYSWFDKVLKKLVCIYFKFKPKNIYHKFHMKIKYNKNYDT